MSTRAPPVALVDLQERLTLNEAIKYLGCSRSWFFRYVRPCVPVYKLHRPFFLKADLDQFVRSRRVDAVGVPRMTRRVRSRPHTTERQKDWPALASKHGLAPPSPRLRRVENEDCRGEAPELACPVPDSPGKPDNQGRT